MFEALKQAGNNYRKRSGNSSGTLLEKGVIIVIAAGSLGPVAAVVIMLIDVVKTRIMLSTANAGKGSSQDICAADGSARGGCLGLIRKKRGI